MNELCGNTEDICRACISDIGDENYDMQQSSDLLELYARLSASQIEPNDSLPKLLCSKCHDSLQAFNAFQKMCTKSYEILLCHASDDAYKCEESAMHVRREAHENDDLAEIIEYDVCFDSDREDFNVKINCIEYDHLKIETYIETSKNSNDAEEASLKSEIENSDDERLIEKVNELKETKKPNGDFKKDARLDCSEINASNEQIITESENTASGEGQQSENDAPAEGQRSDILAIAQSEDKSPCESVASNQSKRTIEWFEELCNDRERRRSDPYACAQCPQKFYSKLCYEGHLREHQGKKPFNCQMCTREYVSLFGLRDHVLHHHNGEEIRYDCTADGCEKTFKTRNSLTIHLNSHFNPQAVKKREKGRVMCELCGKSLSKGVMPGHRMMHEGIFPYTCDQCPKKFRYRCKLTEHKLVQHMGVKKYSCSVCGLKKATRKDVKAHMNVHTREIQFPCQFCKSCFLTNTNLVRHIRVVHDGVKQFHCTFCDQSFGKSETLKHHLMRHTGERPHKCPHCEKTFIQKGTMRTHARTHEKQREKKPKKMRKGKSSSK